MVISLSQQSWWGCVVLRYAWPPTPKCSKHWGIKVVHFSIYFPQQLYFFSPSVTNKHCAHCKGKVPFFGMRTWQSKKRREERVLPVKLDTEGHTNMFDATGGRRGSEMVCYVTSAGRQQECWKFSSFFLFLLFFNERRVWFHGAAVKSPGTLLLPAPSLPLSHPLPTPLSLFFFFLLLCPHFLSWEEPEPLIFLNHMHLKKGLCIPPPSHPNIM